MQSTAEMTEETPMTAELLTIGEPVVGQQADARLVVERAGDELERLCAAEAELDKRPAELNKGAEQGPLPPIPCSPVVGSQLVSDRSGLVRKCLMHGVTGMLVAVACAAVGVIPVQVALAYVFGASVSAGLCVLELRREDLGVRNVA